MYYQSRSSPTGTMPGRPAPRALSRATSRSADRQFIMETQRHFRREFLAHQEMRRETRLAVAAMANYVAGSMCEQSLVEVHPGSIGALSGFTEHLAQRLSHCLAAANGDVQS